MSVKYIHLLGLAASLTLLPGFGRAQTTPCDPSKLQPGLTLLDLSRNTDGSIGTDQNSIIYFAQCVATKTITRTTLSQPFRMSLIRQGCDEVANFKAHLAGRYYSVRRMNDTHPNLVAATDPNPYIGYEYVAGDILDDASGAKLGTFVMNGTIGTNTSRVPMPDATGACYDCSHHQGYITFTFTSTLFYGSATFAEYHFHTLGNPAG
jgi:hypothetical protein